MFNGLGCNLSNLAALSDAETRSVSAENFGGQKNMGARATEGTGKPFAGDLGPGWKISPSVVVPAGGTFTMAVIDGPAAIEHLWLTCHVSRWRSMIFRIFWDDEPDASVCVPVGDFFCNGWCKAANVRSLPIAVNPAGGFNSYFEMPFRRRARVEMTNIGAEDTVLYYQIDFVKTVVPDDYAYFHASWRRKNPNAYKEPFVIADGIEGAGQYVGTYLAWQVNNNGWWGEGEVRFYLDGDEYPTICGTGTEDYFGGAWNFEQPAGQYCTFSAPYSGMHQVIRPDGLYCANTRFSMYRWHIADPIRFKTDLRVTVQDLGWRDGGRYLAQQSDIAATSYWYQTEPHKPQKPEPDKKIYEVI